jgi:hypothetical protein
LPATILIHERHRSRLSRKSNRTEAMEPTRSKVRCALLCSSTARESRRDIGCKTSALSISPQQFPGCLVFPLQRTQAAARWTMFPPLCIDTVVGFCIVLNSSDSPVGCEKLWLQAAQKDPQARRANYQDESGNLKADSVFSFHNSSFFQQLASASKNIRRCRNDQLGNHRPSSPVKKF